MIDVQTLKAMGAGYVPLMVAACLLAALMAYRDWRRGYGRFSALWPRLALLRAATTIASAHMVQHVLALRGITLTPLENLVIDLPAFILVTMPPRCWQQAAIAAAFGVMVFMDVLWACVDPMPFVGQVHYIVSTGAGYIAFGVLIIWSTGVPPGARNRVVDSWRRLAGLGLASVGGHVTG